jgi:hypothetical protein
VWFLGKALAKMGQDGMPRLIGVGGVTRYSMYLGKLVPIGHLIECTSHATIGRAETSSDSSLK